MAAYGPPPQAARRAGAAPRRKAVRHVGQGTHSLKKSGVPKFAYHVWTSSFKPMHPQAEGGQMQVHAPSAYAAAKKVVSLLHRETRSNAETTFILTQRVKVDRKGMPMTATRVYKYQGHFETKNVKAYMRDGTLIKPKGVSVAYSAQIGKAGKSKSGKTHYGGHKRVLVPYVHHEDVRAAFHKIESGAVRAARFSQAQAKPREHRRLRAKHGLYRPRKAAKKGGSSRHADSYDVEPRYGGGAVYAPPVDPYYYGMDPRVGGYYY